MLRQEHLIVPDWPAPARVRALQTTRTGGSSLAPFDSFNLGMHVGDNPMTVAANRTLLNGFVPSEPVWMKQVHGVDVVIAEQAGCEPVADACISRNPGAVCTVMTADCLPLLLCDTAGSVVGTAHAGWRGLAAGVIEATVSAMQLPPSSLMAWLGPAIGPQAFEVGAEVRDIFTNGDPGAAAAFARRPSEAGGREKYLADIYHLARRRLFNLGIDRVFGGGLCTYSDHERFYSYRRDGKTGRMATMIWLSPD